MKNIIKIAAIAICLIIIPWILTAQPLPYDTGIGGGEGTNPVGGGAPLGGGLIMMLIMAAGYGTRKLIGSLKRSR